MYIYVQTHTDMYRHMQTCTVMNSNLVGSSMCPSNISSFSVSLWVFGYLIIPVSLNQNMSRDDLVYDESIDKDDSKHY